MEFRLQGSGQAPKKPQSTNPLKQWLWACFEDDDDNDDGDDDDGDDDDGDDYDDYDYDDDYYYYNYYYY